MVSMDTWYLRILWRRYKWEHGMGVFCTDKDNLKQLGNLEVVWSSFSVLA